jgi:hypothetical protein
MSSGVHCCHIAFVMSGAAMVPSIVAPKKLRLEDEG